MISSLSISTALPLITTKSHNYAMSFFLFYIINCSVPTKFEAYLVLRTAPSLSLYFQPKLHYLSKLSVINIPFQGMKEIIALYFYCTAFDQARVPPSFRDNFGPPSWGAMTISPTPPPSALRHCDTDDAHKNGKELYQRMGQLGMDSIVTIRPLWNQPGPKISDLIVYMM
jgi:hypothetical protein